MDDLISRQAAIDAANTALFPKIYTAKDAEKALRGLPSAGPRMRGRWEKIEVDPICDAGIEEVQAMRCSECKRWLTVPYVYYLTKYDFCPNCGADMRGEDDEKCMDV